MCFKLVAQLRAQFPKKIFLRGECLHRFVMTHRRPPPVVRIDRPVSLIARLHWGSRILATGKFCDTRLNCSSRYSRLIQKKSREASPSAGLNFSSIQVGENQRRILRGDKMSRVDTVAVTGATSRFPVAVLLAGTPSRYRLAQFSDSCLRAR